MKSKFPKVLIISEFFFGEKTGGQILLKNLFEKYPKEKILFYMRIYMLIQIFLLDHIY